MKVHQKISESTATMNRISTNNQPAVDGERFLVIRKDRASVRIVEELETRQEALDAATALSQRHPAFRVRVARVVWKPISAHESEQSDFSWIPGVFRDGVVVLHSGPDGMEKAE